MLASKAIPLGLAGGFTLVAAAAFLAWKLWRAATRRRRELAALAEELGFTFDPHERASGLDAHMLFKVFRGGISTAVGPTLEGETEILGDPCKVIIGDCHCHRRRFHDPGRTETKHFSYVLVCLPHDRPVGPPDQRRAPPGPPLSCAERWCCVSDGETMWPAGDFVGAVERIRAHVESQYEDAA